VSFGHNLVSSIGTWKRGGRLSQGTGWRWREAPDGSATVVPTTPEAQEAQEGEEEEATTVLVWRKQKK